MDVIAARRSLRGDDAGAIATPELVRFLADQPDLVAAYLFGSRARGESTETSDWDFAVLLEPAPAEDTLERRLQLMDELGQIVGSGADVVVLNDAPPLLGHEILRDGVLLVERDIAARVEFEVRTGKLYCDSRWTRRYFIEAMRVEIKAGGLGGRE